MENSDLEVVTENVAATTSNMEDELTNEVQSPPNPQKRISGKQRKACLLYTSQKAWREERTTNINDAIKALVAAINAEREIGRAHV